MPSLFYGRLFVLYRRTFETAQLVLADKDEVFESVVAKSKEKVKFKSKIAKFERNKIP